MIDWLFWCFMSYRQYLIQPHTDLHNKAHMNNEATLSNFYMSRMHVHEEFFLYIGHSAKIQRFWKLFP